jgi:hypothetical protein
VKVVTTSSSSLLRPAADDAAAAWRALVDAAHEQVRRLADEDQHGTEEFLAARLPSLRPGASPSEELEYLRSLARPDDVWLEIGSAAGRLAIPLALAVGRFVAVDPSARMRDALQTAASEAGVASIDLRDGSWPDDADALPEADVTLAANMFYAMAEPLPFVEAMERRARRLCVVTAADRPGRSPDPDVWADVMGEPHLADPGAADLVVLLLATGRRADVRWFVAPPPRALPPEQAVEQHRWRLGLRADSPRLAALRDAVARRVDGDGLARLRSGRSFTAVITWEPAPRQPGG